MNDGITKDYSISLIRFLATVSIIVCHLFQFYDHELAWWFNIGVQMFLCISGFLYAKKGVITDDLKFYKKTFTKILVDYYIIAIPAFVILTVFFFKQFSVITAIQVLFTKAVLPGGGHLWYIPYCLLCYFLTPLLSRFFDRHKNKHLTISFVILFLILITLIDLFFHFFVGAWIFCYILGYFLGVVSLKGKTKLYNAICLIIIAIAVVSNTAQILLDYVIKFEFNEVHYVYYKKMCNYAHVALGTALFLLLKKLFAVIFKNGYPTPIQKFCSISDRYSYDVYLVHHFIILGPLTLMTLTKIPILNIVIILVLIVLLAVIVNLISAFIKNKLKKFTEL